MSALQALPAPASLLGESPFWHPDEAALYWCDIPGRALHRYSPAVGAHRQWSLESEPGCCAPLPGGRLLLAMRDGLFGFDPASGRRERLAGAPYDGAQERFNDGKADPQGRLWVGTIYEPRQPPNAALYRWAAGRLDRIAGGITVSNGLAFSPDGRTMYWADTSAHRVYAFDFDGSDGSLSRRRVHAEFAPRQPGQALADYGGRPDGAAVDAEGCYWVAMYEGQRLLRLAPDGRLLRELPLPVRCPTMPCFGGPDLRTLFITTARNHRPAEELAAQPLAGRVLSLRVDVPGLPVHFVRG
ncbi:MAG: SMP-30/gluconolactonase/LRE family protein [Burkholderiales bacterium]|nr:SMP-30/gluconolactonase/LRE family protein [Burkholderiales bacterium]